MLSNENAPKPHEKPAVATADERRSSRRNRVLKRGSIHFNSGYASYQCTIRNVSEKGALLIFGDTSGLPSEFDFQVVGEKQKSRARLAWRDREKIGIEMIPGAEA